MKRIKKWESFLVLPPSAKIIFVANSDQILGNIWIQFVQDWMDRFGYNSR